MTTILETIPVMMEPKNNTKSPVRSFFHKKKKKLTMGEESSPSPNHHLVSSSSSKESVATDDTAEMSSTSAAPNGEIESCLSAGGTNINLHVRNLEHPGIPTMEEKEAPVLKLAHPSLTSLQVTDVTTTTTSTTSEIIIHPNSDVSHHISNEWMEMDMIIMLRTPNVDDPSQPTGTTSNQDVSKYFQGKQRRFEFQYQVQLKKPLQDKELCFAMELDHSLKLNLFQKALVSTCLVFMKKMSPSFRYNLYATKDPDETCYETSYMAFAVERALDRLHTTPPNEVPPKLGTNIPEDAKQIHQRKDGKLPVDWKCDGTIYTMALWSHYIDWIQWQVVHIPGVKHFSMNHLLGENQAVYMQLYMLDKHRKDKNKHYQKDKEHVVNLKLQHQLCKSSNSRKATLKQQQHVSSKKKLHLFGR